MTQYKIQIGSWTKLPNSQVQEDTRDIMEMMGKVCGVSLEKHVTSVGNFLEYVSVRNSFKGLCAVVQGEPHVVTHNSRCNIKHTQSLFIPYEELQKMLNVPQVQEMPKVSSLLNTKLDCRKPDGTVDEELSRAFQEACFEQGIKWLGTDDTVQYLSSPFLFVEQYGCLSHTTLQSEKFFYEFEDCKQINFKYSRTLTWEATEVKPPEPEPVDEMVNICGVEYSAKELNAALELIKKSRKE
ncbi:hypothetical protein S14_105 [Shewanella sp. phage 1/4]|uniref:hypothetical protein n=1 Tax=Shewanella phage 1/4 TaxID=1458859 RepID=UPI0004F6C2B8|nr:hypothetical protein S14_105 [Shewanella sp. phage 1/4]AHK11214.1 hypothetical protein S14_105 [Shewanella sp. phage 1/4]